MKNKYLIVCILIFAIIVTLTLLRKNNNKEKLICEVKYVEIAIEDTEAQGLALTTPVKITDKDIIERLEEQVNKGIEYEPKSTAWSDISPHITFYLENGEQYSSLTDKFETQGEEDIGNYITIFKLNSNGEEDLEYNKKTYKIEDDLVEYANQLYNQFK